MHLIISLKADKNAEYYIHIKFPNHVLAPPPSWGQKHFERIMVSLTSLECDDVTHNLSFVKMESWRQGFHQGVCYSQWAPHYGNCLQSTSSGA